MNTVRTTQEPKRQHVIPRMLLRNFQGKDEKIHAYVKNEAKHIYTSPENLFVKKHRYTLRGDEYSGDRYEIESRLEKIETRSAPIIRKIVGSRKSRLDPPLPLTREEGDAVKLFLITLFLRTDHHADEIVPLDQYEHECRAEGFRQAEIHGVDRSEWQKFQDGPEFSAILEDFLHDLRARVAIGSPSKIAYQIEEFMRKSGLLIAMPGKGASGFIVGDCGGAYVPNLDSPGRFYRWLPVSREVAIGETEDGDNVNYIDLSRREVNRINWTTFEASDIVVVQRRSDLDYCVHRWENSSSDTR